MDTLKPRVKISSSLLRRESKVVGGGSGREEVGTEMEANLELRTSEEIDIAETQCLTADS